MQEKSGGDGVFSNPHLRRSLLPWHSAPANQKAKYRHTVKEASQFRSYTSLIFIERLVMAVAKSAAIYTKTRLL